MSQIFKRTNRTCMLVRLLSITVWTIITAIGPLGLLRLVKNFFAIETVYCKISFVSNSFSSSLQKCLPRFKIAHFLFTMTLQVTFGLILPYIAVIVLFGYLVALINQRKSNKTTALADSYEYTNGGDMEMKTATDVLSDYSGKIELIAFIFPNLSVAH